MARFNYTAISRNGEVTTGKIDADTKEIATERLQQKKLQVAKISRDWTSLELTPAKVKLKDVVIFTRQMASMSDAGLPLTRTLAILYEQSESKKLKETIHQILVGVESGETLSAAMAHHPRVFPEMYTKLVVAGESSGQLPETLDQLADFMERSEEINARVKGAFVYPLMVGGITMAAMGVLYAFVIPSFEDMFEGLEELPWLTSVNIAISHVIRDHPLLVIGGLIATIAGFWYAFNNPISRALFDRWGLKLPVIGTVIRKTAIARFTGTLATLLGSGVRLMDALLLCADTAGNIVVKEAINSTRRAVSEGDNLANPLRRTNVFPPMVTSMIAVGEQTGDLEAMLVKVAGFYEKDVRQTIDAALELIKPATMVVLALMVGAVLISVYLPMFDSMVNFGQ